MKFMKFNKGLSWRTRLNASNPYRLPQLQSAHNAVMLACDAVDSYLNAFLHGTDSLGLCENTLGHVQRAVMRARSELLLPAHYTFPAYISTEPVISEAAR